MYFQNYFIFKSSGILLHIYLIPCQNCGSVEPVECIHHLPLLLVLILAVHWLYKTLWWQKKNRNFNVSCFRFLKGINQTKKERENKKVFIQDARRNQTYPTLWMDPNLETRKGKAKITMRFPPKITKSTSTMNDIGRSRDSPKRYWGEVIRLDMTLDRRLWRTHIRIED